jgi:hypothetical protein
MKNKLSLLICGLAAALARRVEAQTAFTYQGKLNDGANPATGLYDMTFTLFDAVASGNQVGSTFASNAVPVTNGLFTISLDFGSAPFNGSARWLAVDVKTNGSTSYTALSPRTALSPTPYAIYAQTAGNVPSGAITASKIAAGQVVKSLNGLTDAVNLTAGANVTLIPSGNNIQIAATGVSPFALNGTNAYYTAGAVGIGTMNPAKTLQVGDFNVPGTEGMVRLGSRDLSGRGSAAWDIGVPPSSDAQGGDAWDFVIRDVYPGSGDKVVVKGVTGRVGIGTATPGALLEVSGPTGTQRISDTTSGNSIVLEAGTGNDMKVTGYNYSTGSAVPLYLSVDGADTILNSGGGNVGIGTTAPGTALEVSRNVAAGSGPVLRLNRSSQAAGQLFLSFADADSDVAGIYVPAGSDDLRFNNGAADLATVTSSGNLGVGTTSPSASLHVKSGDDYNNPQLELEQSNASDFSRLRFQVGTEPLWDIAVGGSGNGDVMNFYHQGNGNVMSLTPTGGLTVAVLTITGGSDVAEPFKMPEVTPKGAVVVIDEELPGHLKVSERAYDTHVAGIVSGADGINPGLSLHQEGVLEGGKNVALSGRVKVMADASNGSIRPGDLLTTSDIPGHCMKVTDHTKARGAIIGKAMSTLEKGNGYVLVLVSLQ